MKMMNESNHEIRKIPVIIDTDPGVDDLVSILWALSVPKLDIRAITVTNGNVGIDRCVKNALRALELCGRQDIPVYRGAYRPFLKPVIDAGWYHGADGLGDIGLPEPTLRESPGYAAQRMADIAIASPEPVTILALAPLTNLAMAILLEPKLAEHVEKIIFMGGAVQCEGNESPRASYNVKVDSEAAKVVYSSGIPIVQVGLDVCDLVTQDFGDLDKIVATGGRIGNLLGALLYKRKDRVTRPILDIDGNELESPFPLRKEGIGLNDLTATGYLINPSWFDTRSVWIDIETSGICDGETVADFMGLRGHKPNTEFACGVDCKALVSQWVEDMSRFSLEHR